MRYAQNTEVGSDRSKAEIERLLSRYGAEQFVSGWDRNSAKIGFSIKGRNVRFTLPMPDKNDPEFWKTPGGRRKRDENAAWKAWEQATRQRWRALALVIKAKLEAVDCSITTFDEEFMSHVVMPNGQTVGEMALPIIASAYATQKMPVALLPGF